MERVLRLNFLKVLVLLSCLLGCTQSVLATTATIPSDDDMVIGARAIVRGKVLSIGSGFDEQQNRIFTYITLRVQEVIKGQISEHKIVIKEEGGQVGMRGSRIFGTPEFTLGEQVLLYLDTWADGSLRVHQLFLGKFSIVEDPNTGKLIVVRSTADADVVMVNSLPRSNQAKGAATEKMELAAYTEMVRGKLAANLQRSQEFEERYYHGANVLARPPEFTSKSKAGQIEPQYVFLSPSSPPRWFEIDSGQAVTFSVNTDKAFDSQPVADVQAAMNAWSTIPGSALRVAYGGTTSDCGPGGVNTIIFNGCDGRWAPGSSCQGILALGGCGWYGTTKVVNGTTFYQATNGFVSMNPYASCYFANQSCNVSEVLTHELGHALGLGHTSDSTATMYFQAHFDGRCAATKADDNAAMVFIYPGTGGGSGPLSISTSSLPAGTTGTAYNQALSGAGGTLPYNWSLVAGQGTLPTGLSLSAAGIISGTPSAIGTSNFTVKVTDSASPAASVQKALSIVVAATGASPLDSQFISQTVPTSVTPGQSFNVDLKFLNTGTQAWSGGGNFYLVSQNPPLNQTWGGNGLSLGSNLINSGQTLDASFAVTAPSAAGTYNFQWQMYLNDGTAFFGQMSANVAIQVGTAPPTQKISKIGLYSPGGGAFFLRNSNTGGIADMAFTYGPAAMGFIPLVGDWDGNGTKTTGLYDPAHAAFFLRNSNTAGMADITFTYGPAGLGFIPLVGDWNGDGIDTIGLYDPSHAAFFLRNSNSGGVADITFTYGPAGLGFIPIVGDWNGDGTDTIGLYNPANAAFFLRNSNSGGIADIAFTYGPAGLGFAPIVGDWNGDGTVTIGLYDPAHAGFFLRNSNSGGVADITFTYGPGGLGWTALGGDWDGL
jgi:hypothetical protein